MQHGQIISIFSNGVGRFGRIEWSGGMMYFAANDLVGLEYGQALVGQRVKFSKRSPAGGELELGTGYSVMAASVTAA